MNEEEKDIKPTQTSDRRYLRRMRNFERETLITVKDAINKTRKIFYDGNESILSVFEKSIVNTHDVKDSNSKMIQLIVVNRQIAQTLDGNKDVAVISISTPGDDFPQISPAFGAIGKWKFHDIVEPPTGFSFENLFNETIAIEILEFVKSCVNSGITKFIVHCDAGISRSPGVAVAMNEIYNDVKIVPPEWRLYNRRVYRILLNVHNSRA